MVLYLTVNQVDSCHGCVCDLTRWDREVVDFKTVSCQKYFRTYQFDDLIEN